MPRTPSNPHPLRDVREAARITQAKLAKRIGVATVTIQKIENGKLAITGEIAEKLRLALGCIMYPSETPEGGKVWNVHPLMPRGGDSMSPYTYEDFVASASQRKFFSGNPEVMHLGLSGALFVVIQSAARSGQLASLIPEIEARITDWIEDFSLESPMIGWLQDNGFDPTCVQNLITGFKDGPRVGGLRYHMAVADQTKAAAEAAEAAGTSTTPMESSEQQAASCGSESDRLVQDPKRL